MSRAGGKAVSKSNLPTKTCVVCGLDFTWRKKWEDCWDEVTTCSKRCNTERRRQNRQVKLEERGAGGDGEMRVVAVDPEAPGVGLAPASDAGSQGAPSEPGGEAASAAEAPPVADTWADEEGIPDARAARKAKKKAMKAQRRAVREGNADESVGRKECDLCASAVDLLVRCQVDEDGEWKMVCGRCWKTPEVAGGVVDGDGSNPNYRYGGLWKNHHKKK